MEQARVYADQVEQEKPIMDINLRNNNLNQRIRRLEQKLDIDSKIGMQQNMDTIDKKK